MTVRSKRDTTHTVRTFEPGDRDGFLSLYETVFGDERSARWFEWKYEANPFADHVPIVVGERDGEIVGCRSFFPLEMRVDGETLIAYQPCDTMVHPDHRGQGLCSRMNERALERYGDGEPAFFFNFPNEASKPVNVKYGWRPVGGVSMYYRLQNPVGALSRFVGERDGDGAGGGRAETETIRRGLERASAGPVAGLDRLRAALAGRSSDVDVTRYRTVPANRLERAAARAPPRDVHSERSAAFYRWRLSNPSQRYVSYVATRGETPVAALIVSPRPDRLRIVDALPRAIDAESAAIERLFLTAVADFADRPLVTAFADTLPAPVRHLFVPDACPPMDRLIEPSARTLYVRDLEDLGLEEGSIDEWALSRLDLDTS